MKLIYHLPCLTYDFNNSKFVEFEYEQAVKFLKLVYKDMQFFQKDFLSKLEYIPNLEKLCIDLGSQFCQVQPLSLGEINNIKNYELKELALHHHDREISIKKEQKKNSFSDTIDKIRDFLNKAEPDNKFYWLKFPASLSELVIEKEYFTINSIPEYKITLEKEYIEFDVKNIDNLILNEHIKYLVCQKCNIKELQLNPKLELLDAYQNEITRIELSENLIEVDLRSNPLEYIKINKNLKSLQISHPKNFNIEIDNSIGNAEVEIYYIIN